MDYCITIAGLDVVVEYDYKITSRGCRAHMGSLSYSGHPAEPMEYEITVEGLREDAPGSPWLALPGWLLAQLEAKIAESDKVYFDICEAEAEGGYDD